MSPNFSNFMTPLFPLVAFRPQCSRASFPQKDFMLDLIFLSSNFQNWFLICRHFYIEILKLHFTWKISLRSKFKKKCWIFILNWIKTSMPITVKTFQNDTKTKSFCFIMLYPTLQSYWYVSFHLLLRGSPLIIPQKRRRLWMVPIRKRFLTYNSTLSF